MGKGIKALLTALGITASLAAQAITAQWTAIDVTPEGPGRVNAISASGVAVGCRDVSVNETRAFVYANGARQDLPSPAGTRSCAGAVNNGGLIAGNVGDEMVLWENGVMRSLGANGAVVAMNDAGVLVGWVADGTTGVNGTKNSRAFMYSNGAFTDLGAPSGWTYAFGINRRGQIAVFSNGKLFIHENGVLRDLGVTVTNARGFNDKGEIVGQASFGHGPEPFIYDGVVRQIPGAYSFAGAVGINNVGQVLGSGEGVYGFLVEGGQVARMDTLLGAPWNHSEPLAINDRGWIGGQGGNTNDFHAFLLVPKENVAPAASGNGNPLMRYAPKSRPLLVVRERLAP